MKTRKSSLGFILLRHVNSEESNQYWKVAYQSIRHYYTNPIVIIDDHSTDFLTDMPMKNTIVVQSEYPGRGELLPYYYYAKHKWFDQAVILHDSVFLRQKIDFHVPTYQFLWEFIEPEDYVPTKEKKCIRALKNHEKLLDLYESGQWKGCFGGMTAIRHSFLKEIDKQYDLSRLLPLVKKRKDRMSLERVLACMFQLKEPAVSFFGNIFHHGTKSFRYSYQDYLKKKPNLPILKIWVGR